MRAIKMFISFLLKTCTYVVKRETNWIVFGSWCGQYYLDNPRYIYEYLLKSENDYRLIWIGEESISQEVPQSSKTLFVNKHSIKAIYYLLKCKYIFISQSAEVDLSPFSLYRNAIITQCWHGVPVKKIGSDMASGGVSQEGVKVWLSNVVHRILSLPIKYTYFVSASPKNDEIFEKAFKFLGATHKNILHSGYPRNDMFYNLSQEEIEKMKLKYSKLLGFSMEQRIILYLPTYRRKQPIVETICDRSEEDISMLSNILSNHKATVIEKNHFQTYIKTNTSQQRNVTNLFIKLDKEQKVNIQEILLFTDILISDYSGAFLDFCLLDRPIIHFAYDYDYYKDIDSGLYYDIKDFSAGKIAFSFKEVVDELEDLLIGIDKYRQKRMRVRNEYMTYEQGCASEYICNKVLKEIS